ncbi:MAG: KH domain-containing protein [Thermosynechococcaceae cyanobacterium]
MSENTTTGTSDYAELVRFLVTPFLEVPEKLSIHCETYANGKTWVRMAFDDADKGHVFGRNGRTIQAMRSVVETAGKLAGQSVHLEVFGSPASSGNDSPRGGGSGRRREGPKKPFSKPVIKSNKTDAESGAES